MTGTMKRPTPAFTTTCERMTMKQNQRIELVERMAQEQAHETEMLAVAGVMLLCLVVLVALIGIVRSDVSVYFLDEIGRGLLWPGAR
jgi:CHASE3 domain sensor protein